MYGRVRATAKRLPFIGPRLFKTYLRVRYREGEILTITGGPLSGLRFKRFVRTYFDGFVDGTFESELMEAIEREVAPGSTFFDIGANAGLISMAAARTVGPDGRVIAFEPHPETAAELRQQLDLNEFDSVVIEEVALSDRDGTAEFADDGPSDMLGLMSVDGIESDQTVAVTTARLDSNIERYGAPDAIKIDVEGADMLVLDGARATLVTHKPTVFMELHTPGIADEYARFMDTIGYRHFELDGSPIEGSITSRHIISKPG